MQHILTMCMLAAVYNSARNKRTALYHKGDHSWPRGAVTCGTEELDMLLQYVDWLQEQDSEEGGAEPVEGVMQGANYASQVQAGTRRVPAAIWQGRAYSYTEVMLMPYDDFAVVSAGFLDPFQEPEYIEGARAATASDTEDEDADVGELAALVAQCS